MRTAMMALYGCGVDLAFVHGGGSFGHTMALRYGLTSSKYQKSSAGVSETRLAMHNLSYLVYIQLSKAGFKPYLLHANSMLGADGSPVAGYDRRLSALVKSGLTPLTHGDVMLFDRGYKIVSGDKLAQLFCKALMPARMVYVFDQPGILKRAGDPSSLIERLTIGQAKKMVLEGARDATGGIAAKLKVACEVASMGIDTCFVSGFNRDGLIRAVSGERFEGTLLQR